MKLRSGDNTIATMSPTPAFKPTTEELRAGLQRARSTLFIAEARGNQSPEWIANVKAVIAALYKKLGDLAPEGEADYRDHEPKPAAPAAVDDLTPEYLEKLRHDCLVAANVHLRGRSAEEIVAEAARDLELGCVSSGAKPMTDNVVPHPKRNAMRERVITQSPEAIDSAGCNLRRDLGLRRFSRA